ncbi:MAG: hypothetical protein LBQ36_00920 [Synergistaceae bacterium]|nr:hypothetical protein [Synergistaceae bacterium]
MTGISTEMLSGRRRGFSLILTLLVAICGAAMLGGMMVIAGSFATQSAVSMRSEEAYNILQEEIERGKAILKRAMSGASMPLKKKSGAINTLDALLVYDGANPLCDVSRNIRLFGSDAELKVAIYDMEYEISDIPPNPTDEFLASLPQSFVLTAQTGISDGSAMGVDQIDAGAAIASGNTDVGAYAIRATITYADGTERTIETAVLQSVGLGNP